MNVAFATPAGYPLSPVARESKGVTSSERVAKFATDVTRTSIKKRLLSDLATAHSAAMPASLTTFCHLTTSFAMNSPKRSGLPPTATNPCLANLSAT